jgi:hypothetical protein
LEYSDRRAGICRRHGRSRGAQEEILKIMFQV